jgi:hypothetical protein
MTKQQLKRHIENQRYMAEKKAAGYQVATFLVPTAICEDVRKYASSGMFWGIFIERDRGLTHPGGKRYPS